MAMAALPAACSFATLASPPPRSPLAFSSRRSFLGKPFSFSVVSHPGPLKFSPLPVRATTTTEETTTATTTSEAAAQAEDLLADLKAKWDAVENKSTVLVYGGGALVALWLSSTIVGAVNSVPLLPKVLELVGIGYTGWFVYRYLLFKESRKELVSDIEDLKAKITGAGKEQ